jgi:fatty acid desaturase
VHLAHHQNYFTDRDPDYLRKQGPAWTFPQRLRHLLGLFLRDLTGLSVLNTIRGKGGDPSTTGRVTRRWQIAARIAFYAIAALLITWAHLWSAVLLYWLLPLVTILQVIVRWGAICEHKYDLIHPDVVESTPIIEPRWWESLLLPNLNFTLHIYHHWFPRIPFSRLPEVHRIFRQEGLVDEASLFRGYGAYARHLLTP